MDQRIIKEGGKKMTYTKEGYILNELYKKYYSFYCTWYISDIIRKIEQALYKNITGVEKIHEYIKNNF